MSLGYVYVGIMIGITVITAAAIIKWMSQPNDKYDDMLEKLAKDGELK